MGSREYRLGNGRQFFKFYFWAQAIGSKGSYRAGESVHFFAGWGNHSPNVAHKGTAQGHRDLVAFLVNKGWEPTYVAGIAWYDGRFRRRSEP